CRRSRIRGADRRQPGARKHARVGRPGPVHARARRPHLLGRSGCSGREHQRSSREAATVDDAGRPAELGKRPHPPAHGARWGCGLIAVIATMIFTGGGGAGPAPPGGPSLRWKFKTGGFVGSSPAIDRGHVFFGSQNQDVYSVDATTGTEKWHFETGKIVFSSP